MPSPLLFWLLLAWAAAVVVALLKLAFDALAADARGTRLTLRSLWSVVRVCIRCGVAFSSVVVFAAIFKTIEEIWDLSLKPFSYDLTAYSEFVKRAVLAVAFGICFVMVVSLVDRLLDRLLPDGPADRTPASDNSNAGGVANGR